MVDQPSRVYDELALAACERAEAISRLDRKAARSDKSAFAGYVKLAAEDDNVRAERDRLWEEAENRLRDSRAYTLDDVQDWITGEIGCEIGRSSLHRLRKKLLAKAECITRRARLAAEVAKRAADGGADDLFAGSMALAAQHVFDMLYELPDEATEIVKPNHLLGLLEMVARLNTARAQVDLTDQRIAEMREKFDAAVADRAEGGDRRELTTDDITAIRRAVFGG